MRRRNRTSVIPQQRHCVMCINNVKAIDYKDTDSYRRFLSSYGKIVPKRKSGACAKHQRMLSQAIKRARIMALIPFMVR
jgi:small subunit ribosomal protein S18